MHRSAQLGYQRTPFAPAMASTLDVSLSTMPPGIRLFLKDRQHLGWMESKGIIRHNRATLGYRSFIGFDPKTRTGVVVLSNGSAHAAGIGPDVEDIGQHLLNSKSPLLGAKELQPPKTHREISVTPDLLDRYAGRYEASSTYFPESDITFLSKILDGQIVLETDRAGRATELVWSTYGTSKHYKRVQP